MSTARERLLLDEMLPARVADELRRRGHDVMALVADPELRARSDEQVYAWAGEHERRVVTENVKDFRRLTPAGDGPGVLLTSSRHYPRSRSQLGRLVDALDHWLSNRPDGPRAIEDWLTPNR